jgi:hypothetical protein
MKQHTHGLWTHDTRPISFSLVVDDFGVKYVSREHAEHLKECNKMNYKISSDWNGGCHTDKSVSERYRDTDHVGPANSRLDSDVMYARL